MHPSPKKTVVVADDHERFRELVTRVLEPLHAVVDSVPSGEALLTAWERHRPDICVVDIDMPGMDGIEAIRELRHRGADATVIVLTVSEDPALVETTLRAGAQGFVVKKRMTSDLPRALEVVASGSTFVSAGLSPLRG
jgi:DNA-binding NarL/FixJ family response regulator